MLPSESVVIRTSLPAKSVRLVENGSSVTGMIAPALAEPLKVAMDNGARRALIPLENKRNFLEVSGDIVERVDPIFFSDPMTAALKALGMT
jgi:ATP-dependent Lon protease